MLLKDENKCFNATPSFIYDEACLDILNTLNESITVQGQYEECVGCKFKDYAVLPPNGTTSILINTKFSMRMKFSYDGETNCSWTEELFEHYRYGWNLTSKCTPLYIKEPADNEYLPILSAFIILFFFGTIWYMVKCIYKCTKGTNDWRRYFVFNNSEIENVNVASVLYFSGNVNDLGTPSDNAPLVIERPPPLRKHPNRVKSIDVFRGLAIVLMIFVNYGGGQYWFFKHSVWNGLTVADLIFPWFIWVMALSYSLSMYNKLRRAVPRRLLVVQVIRRSFILIILGVILNSHGVSTDLNTLRFPGVLQHLGLVYLIVGVTESLFSKRTYSTEDYGRFSFLMDILMSWPQWLFVLTLLTVHICVTFLVDIPGCGKGYLGPGGLHEQGNYENCTGGVAGYIDRSVFGEHMYEKPTCHQVYETTVYFDPEGILGTLTSVFLAYLGIQAGRIYNVYTNSTAKLIRWVIWGVVTGLIGCILCNFSKNGGVIPMNKNLWSVSFVLVLGGLAFLIQAYLYLIVDVKRKWGGRPLFYPGMNPLILYLGHQLFKDTFPFSWTPVVKTHAAYLAINLWGTALWVAIAIFLYRKNIFLNI